MLCGQSGGKCIVDRDEGLKVVYVKWRVIVMSIRLGLKALKLCTI